MQNMLLILRTGKCQNAKLCQTICCVDVKPCAMSNLCQTVCSFEFMSNLSSVEFLSSHTKCGIYVTLYVVLMSNHRQCRIYVNPYVVSMFCQTLHGVGLMPNPT